MTAVVMNTMIPELREEMRFALLTNNDVRKVIKKAAKVAEEGSMEEWIITENLKEVFDDYMKDMMGVAKGA